MFRIRAATLDDAESITKIYSHHVRHGTGSFEVDPPTCEEITRRMAALRDGGYPYLVAEQDGGVAGYAYAGAYRPRAAYRDTVENSVYVRPDLGGKGIGSQLLGELIAACAVRGFRQMIAVVGDSANTPSIRLHEKLGFRCVGTFQAVGYKQGRWLDTVLLQIALGDGATTPPQRVA